MFWKDRETRLLLADLQGYFDHIGYRLELIEAMQKRLEKLIRVAAPHPLGEPK